MPDPPRFSMGFFQAPTPGWLKWTLRPLAARFRRFHVGTLGVPRKFRGLVLKWKLQIPCIWMFPKIGGFPPKWMVKIMENPFNMDDFGVKPTILGNTHINK